MHLIFCDNQDIFSNYADKAKFYKGWSHPDLHPDRLLEKRNLLLLIDDSGDTDVQKQFLRDIFVKFSHHK